MRNLKAALAMAVVAAAMATTAQAQQKPGKFSLEMRGGAAFPTEKLGTYETKTGVNFDLTAQLQVMPHLAIYGGGDWAQVQLKQRVLNYEDVIDSGWAFGVKFYAPSVGFATPFVRGGGVVDHIELEGDRGNDDYISAKHVLGWEVGAGAAIPLGGAWSVLPGARYRSFTPEMAELGGKVNMRYITVDLGISATFGGNPMAAIKHAD